MGGTRAGPRSIRHKLAEAFPVVFAISVSVLGAVLASGAYPHVPARWMQTEDGAAAAALAAASPGTQPLTAEQPVVTKPAFQLLITTTDTSYGWRVKGEGPIAGSQLGFMDGHWRLHAYKGLSLGSRPALLVNTTASVFHNNDTARDAFDQITVSLGGNVSIEPHQYGDVAAFWTIDHHTDAILIRRANVVWGLEFTRDNPASEWDSTMRWFATSLVSKAA